jgi:hypothetical protein
LGSFKNYLDAGKLMNINLVRQLNFIFVFDADSLDVVPILELHFENFVFADCRIPEAWQIILK